MFQSTASEESMEAAARPRLSLTFTSVPFRLRVEAAGLFTYTALTCFLVF